MTKKAHMYTQTHPAIYVCTERNIKNLDQTKTNKLEKYEKKKLLSEDTHMSMKTKKHSLQTVRMPNGPFQNLGKSC